jgi:beta-glucanase (GH16 family)
MKQAFFFMFLVLLFLTACGTPDAAELKAEAFSGTYTLQVKHSGLYLEVPGSANGTQARQNTRSNSSAQRFRFEGNGGGWYKIIHASSGKALEIDNQSFWLNGAKVQLWDKYTYDNQLWKLEAVGGYYKIINKQSGKALDVSGVSRAAGANVHQWEYLSQDNQLWKLVTLGSTPAPTPTPTPTPTPAPTPAGQPVGPGGTWTMSFSDEFNGASLDTGKWSYGFGWGSPYSDAFTECTSPEQVKVAGGLLTITPKNSPPDPRICNRIDGFGKYTSGVIQTKNKFSQQYGYFEVRMKGAQGSGFASAFWGKRVDETWPPEIDVVEILGKNRRYYHTVHHKSPYAGSNDNWSHGNNFGEFDPTTGFHTYGVEWSPTFIKWYVDGNLVKTYQDYANIPSVMNMVNGQAYYWLINLHIGSTTWKDMGMPDNSTNWSSTMQVDWVRIWKR